MDDLISRQATYETLSEYYHHSTEVQHQGLREALSRVPSAEPVRMNGRWVHCDDGSISYRCSLCGKHQYGNYSEIFSGEFHFCPNCGARMSEGEEE